MEVYVSPNLNQEERSSVDRNFSILFPNGKETEIFSQKASFRVVSEKEFSDAINEKTRPFPITATVLDQIRENSLNVRQFTVPDSGLININLYKKSVAFSGLSHDKRIYYKNLVKKLGGIPSMSLNTRTSFLVATNAMSDRVKFARKYSIVCVLPAWIDSLTKNFVPYDDFLVKRLTGCRFTLTGITRNQSELESKIVSEGGIIENSLKNTTNFVVMEESPDLGIIRTAIDIMCPITTPDKIMNLNSEDYIDTIASPCFQSDVFKGLKMTSDCSVDKRKMNILIQENGGTCGDDVLITNVNDGSGRCRSIAWFQRCIEAQKLYDPESFPLFIPPERCSFPLKFVQASVTQYTGEELLNIIAVFRMLGIEYKNVLTNSSVFLIAKEKRGKKYEFAVEKGINVYTIEVLELIAKDGINSDLSKFTLFNKSMNPKKKKIEYISDDETSSDDFDPKEMKICKARESEPRVKINIKRQSKGKTFISPVRRTSSPLEIPLALSPVRLSHEDLAAEVSDSDQREESKTQKKTQKGFISEKGTQEDFISELSDDIVSQSKEETISFISSQDSYDEIPTDIEEQIKQMENEKSQHSQQQKSINKSSQQKKEESQKQFSFLDSSTTSEDEIDEEYINKVISSGEYKGESDICYVKTIHEHDKEAAEDPNVEFISSSFRSQSSQGSSQFKPVMAKVEDQIPEVDSNIVEKIMMKMKRISEKNKKKQIDSAKRKSQSFTEESLSYFTQLQKEQSDEDELSDDVIYNSHKSTSMTSTTHNPKKKRDELLDALSYNS